MMLRNTLSKTSRLQYHDKANRYSCLHNREEEKPPVQVLVNSVERKA